MGKNATFDGEGEFIPDGDCLFWREHGLFRIEEGLAMTATRCYRWRFSKGRIFVDYEDGAPFLEFGVNDPRASHLCANDRYDVTYSFMLPKRWTAQWRVLGPRKDYLSSSEMTRI